MTRFRILLAVALSFAAGRGWADDWPMFGRDPSLNRVSPEKNPPLWWQIEQKEGDKITQPEKNVRWSAWLGGAPSYYGSYGDPIVAGGLLWIGTNNSLERDKNTERYYEFRCFDEKTGKRLASYLTPRDPVLGGERWIHTMGGSPLVVGDRMWFYTNRCEAVSLDLRSLREKEGVPSEIWKVDLMKELGVYRRHSFFDCRLNSVTADGDRLFAMTGNGADWWNANGLVKADAPSLVCFDKNTGKILWKDSSPGNQIMDCQLSSPTIISVAGKKQVVSPQGDGWVRSFDAESGKLVWKFDANPPNATFNINGRGDRNYFVASAVFHYGRIYVGTGREPEHNIGPGMLYCIDAAKTGDISPQIKNVAGDWEDNPNSGMLWKFGNGEQKQVHRDFGRTLSNVAVADGLVIACDYDGRIRCLDARTGKSHWVHDTEASIHSSPLIVDRYVYVGDDEGVVTILELSATRKIVAKIEMERAIRASPIFANGVLYIAAGHKLYAIAGNERPAAP
jgi:outer membrane protein assembly factor BamB